jgi:glucose-1-phosphate thymidylyltransferase
VFPQLAVLLARASIPHPASELQDEQTASPAGDGPLALAPVLNEPMIAFTLNSLAEAGIERTVVVAETGVLPAVERALNGVRGVTTLTGLIEWDGERLLPAVDRARGMVGDGPFALHLGAGLSRRNLRGQLESAHVVGEFDAVALMSRFNVPVDRLSSDRTTTGRRGSASPATGAYDAGLYLLGSGFPAAIEKRGERRIMGQIAVALNHMEGLGGRVERRYVADWWCYRGQRQSVLEMNRFVLGSLPEGRCEASILNSDIQGTVIADSSACIESSVIRGPVMIDSDVVIRDAFVGPYSSIGAGVRIENAEVEHSVILEGASISHLGGRLESSVIGRGSRVARDFHIPRGFRLTVGPGSDIALH